VEKGFRNKIIEQLEEGRYMSGRDLLCALLTNAFPSGDFSELCDELLFTFPSVNAVLSADYASLMTVNGMTRRVALYILAVQNTKGHSKSPIDKISNSAELIKKAQSRLKERDCEFAELYLVDREGGVIKYYRFTSGLKSKVYMDAQDFITKIYATDAYGFYVLHNHTGNSPRPSERDDIFTARLLALGAHGGKVFLDHCIVAGNNGFSYRDSGRLKELSSLTSRKS